MPENDSEHSYECCQIKMYFYEESDNDAAQNLTESNENYRWYQTVDLYPHRLEFAAKTPHPMDEQQSAAARHIHTYSTSSAEQISADGVFRCDDDNQRVADKLLVRNWSRILLSMVKKFCRYNRRVPLNFGASPPLRPSRHKQPTCFSLRNEQLECAFTSRQSPKASNNKSPPKLSVATDSVSVVESNDHMPLLCEAQPSCYDVDDVVRRNDDDAHISCYTTDRRDVRKVRNRQPVDDCAGTKKTSSISLTSATSTLPQRWFSFIFLPLILTSVILAPQPAQGFLEYGKQTISPIYQLQLFPISHHSEPAHWSLSPVKSVFKLFLWKHMRKYGSSNS